MQYLSQFEILATPIFPPVEAEPVPFVIQGYFCLVSRLADGVPGDLMVEFTFFPTPDFPTATGGALADLFLVDYQDENGLTDLAASFTGNTLVVPIGSGRTVLVGIQPNAALPALYAAAGAVAPGAAPIAARGYVMIDTAKSAAGGAPAGLYSIAVSPEIRATFLTVTLPNPPASLLNAQTVAYSLPTPNGGLITLTKVKETKEGKDGRKDGTKDGTKDGIKEVHKEVKDIRDGKDPDSGPQPQTALASLSDRIANLEALVGGTGQTFIPPDKRPEVG